MNPSFSNARAGLDTLLELASAMRTADAASKPAATAAYDAYDGLFCRQVLGLRAGVRVADPTSVHGIGLQSWSVVTQRNPADATGAEVVSNLYVTGRLMRTPTKPYGRGSAGRTAALSQAQAKELCGRARIEWMSRQQSSCAADRESLAEHAQDLLERWAASYYGVHRHGIAQHMQFGPFVVESLRFDVVAAREDSIALHIQGRHMARDSYVNFAVPLVHAGLQGLS